MHKKAKRCFTSRFEIILPASAGKAGKHVTRGQLVVVVVGVTVYELKHVKACESV